MRISSSAPNLTELGQQKRKRSKTARSDRVAHRRQALFAGARALAMTPVQNLLNKDVDRFVNPDNSAVAQATQYLLTVQHKLSKQEQAELVELQQAIDIQLKRK